MSLYFLLGVFGYLMLLGALAGSATLAARVTARWLGVPRFRWFTEPANAVPGWRLGVVRLVAAVAPWTVSFVLLSSGVRLDGVATVAEKLRVEVLADGAGRQAGMQNGDRIIRVGNKPVSDWDEMRAALKTYDVPVDLEIERGGKTVVIQVTPRSGRIGVAPWQERRRVGALGAAAAALPLPHTIVRSAFASVMHAAESGTKTAGPVRIVSESEQAAHRGVGNFLTFLGSLAAYMWPFAAGVVLLDGASSGLFRLTYPEAANSSLDGYRLERQRQALFFVYAAYGALALYALVVALDVSWAPVLAILASAPFAAVGPLTWIVGNQFWSRTSVVLCTLLSFFVPCIAFLVVFELRSQLGRRLRAQGFQVNWLRARAPKRG
jgi:hypothetical protein